MSETGKEKKISRRRILKGAAAVGINTLLAACGVSPVEEERREAIKDTESHLKAAAAHAELMDKPDSSAGEEQLFAEAIPVAENQEELKEEINQALRELGDENVKALLIEQVYPGGVFQVTEEKGVNRRQLPSNMADKVGALPFDSRINFSNLYVNDRQAWGKSEGGIFSCVGELDPESGQKDIYMEKIAPELQ